MKILDAAKLLKTIFDKHGNIDLMLIDPQRGNPHLVSSISAETAEKGEFPKEWNMPAGYTYVSIKD